MQCQTKALRLRLCSQIRVTDASFVEQRENLVLAVFLDDNCGLIILLNNSGVDHLAHKDGCPLIALGSLLHDFQFSFNLVKPCHLGFDIFFSLEIFLFLLLDLGLGASALSSDFHHMYTHAVLHYNFEWILERKKKDDTYS